MNVRPFAKAIVGPAFGLLGALAQYVATGHLDSHSLFYFGSGLLGGVVTYFVPNAAPEVQSVDPAFAPVSPDDLENAAAWAAARQPAPAAPAPVPAPPAAPGPGATS